MPDYTADIEDAARGAGIDPGLFGRLVQAESGGRAEAVSSRGAVGLTQLMPATARELGVDPNDPQANLRGGARYYRQQLDRFGNPKLALAAYNWGPGNVQRSQRTGEALPAETQRYIERILPMSETSMPSEASLAGLTPPQRASQQQQFGLLQESARATEDQARLTGEKAETLATGVAGARRGAAEEMQRAVTDYETKRRPIPEFAPTQENAGDLASLFGLLGVFGTLLGGRGKSSALGAMNAMTGMMQGWKQGRQDLYNREKQNFDTNLRQVELQNTELRRGLENALKIAQTNMDAGLAETQVLAAKYDSPILMAAAKSGNLDKVLSTYRQLDTLNNQRLTAQSQVEAAAQRARLEVERDERQNIARSGAGVQTIIRGQAPEVAAQTRASIVQAPLDAVTARRVPGIYDVLDTSEKLARNVRSDPDAVGAFAAGLARYGADPIASIGSTIGNLWRGITGANDPNGARADAAAAQTSQVLAQAEVQLDRSIREAVNSNREFRNLSAEQKEDLITRARTMQKDLFSLALADAVGTGRATVFLERSLSNLYSQANRPETLVSILKSRAGTAETSLNNINPLLGPRYQQNYANRFSLLATPDVATFLGRSAGAPPPPAPRAARGTTQPPVPTQSDIAWLRANDNEENRAKFDERFGVGRADVLLRGQ